MVRIITESKQDIQRFRDKYGDELTDRFLARRKQLRAPYNDIYFWLKDNPLECTDEYIEDYCENGDMDELEAYLDSSESLSNTQQRKIAKDKTKKVYENDTWLVIEPLSFEAALYYGKNTKWCISGNYYTQDALSAENYFDDYDEYLILIDKKNQRKYCFAVDPLESDTLTLWNELDDVLYTEGEWCEDEMYDEITEMPDLPKIKYNDRTYPYIKTNKRRKARIFYDEEGDEQFEADMEDTVW